MSASSFVSSVGDKPCGMQSARIEQLEQRAAVRAVALTGEARRLPRAGDEFGVESAAPAERVTAVGVSMFCSHLSE
ncbi:hypothetical protein [Paraburkholderia sediminicola]|uniref:hypothetical protein n=1 Tax=Paraburkholderia sediminicola TaxID=458836 RepID=UPI0038BE1D79